MAEQSQLRRLNLGANNLWSVPAEDLGRALAGMDELGLEGTYVTEEQGHRLFGEMVARGKGGTTLHVLNLSQNALSSVPEQHFSMIIEQIQEVTNGH